MGDKMVTLKDIAKECNVSFATVSKALNGRPDIGAKTSALIKNKAKEMGYLPNTAARSLKTKHSLNIGVLFVDQTGSGLKHEYFSEILNSVRVMSEKKGYDITFITKNLGTGEMTYYEHTRYRNCDGVVIATVDYKDPDVIELIDSSIPTVTLDYVFDGKTAILSDNIGGMEALVEYVHDQGHRRLAIIHGEDTPVTQKRMASFHTMCKKFNIKIKEEYIKEATYHETKGTEIATKELLELDPRPTCIFFPDDFSFIGGRNEIERMGLSIPDDISVVGYDGILLSQVLRPKLTTYKQNAVKLGELAAEKLVEQIENPKTFIPKQHVVNGEILIGGTVKKLK